VPFKATAGLHHPVRSVQRCTYQADAPPALMHGSQRLPAAALLWHRGAGRPPFADLEEEIADELHFDDEGCAMASTA